MRVVVTGGAGFIGANLARTLVGRGHEVLALDDLSSGRAANLDGVQVDLRVGSVLEAAALDERFAGAGSVVHLAAQVSVPETVDDPGSSHRRNATGTFEVLEAVRRQGVPHVVVASSAAVYGDVDEPWKHEGLAPAPISPYAATKLAAEAYTLAWAASYDLRALAFRFFNVYGPLQPPGHAYAAAVPAFVDAALAGRPIPVHGDGTQTRDFTFVGTVAGVIADAVERQVAAPRAVNLAFGETTSLLDLIAELESILGAPLPREHQPRRAGDVHQSRAEASTLRSLFPDVEPVPLRTGLEATVDWFRGAVR